MLPSDRRRPGRSRSLSSRIPHRQCAGGTRLAAVGGTVRSHREGRELGDETATGASGGAARGTQDGAGASPGARAALTILDDTARSPDPSVCPFLRREVDGKLFAPFHESDEDNRCAAIGIPQPQSDRQQELVCLRAAHADCPRYLRGASVLATPPARRQPAVPRATLAALLVLVLSAGISFGFVVQRGGIDLPVATAAPPATAAALVESPSPAPTPGLTAAPSPSPEPTPSPTLRPTPSPTSSPTVEPTPPPTPRPTRTPAPTSGRYAYLTPCPDRSGCYIYVTRTGNSIWSIGNYFGIPVNTLYAWNPQYVSGGLHVGDPVRMPPPKK